jgi:hypothetical protein
MNLDWKRCRGIGFLVPKMPAIERNQLLWMDMALAEIRSTTVKFEAFLKIFWEVRGI